MSATEARRAQPASPRLGAPADRFEPASLIWLGAVAALLFLVAAPLCAC